MAMGQPNALMLRNQTDDNGLSGADQNSVPGKWFGRRLPINLQHPEKRTMDVQAGSRTPMADQIQVVRGVYRFLLL